MLSEDLTETLCDSYRIVFHTRIEETPIACVWHFSREVRSNKMNKVQLFGALGGVTPSVKTGSYTVLREEPIHLRSVAIFNLTCKLSIG